MVGVCFLTDFPHVVYAVSAEEHMSKGGILGIERGAWCLGMKRKKNYFNTNFDRLWSINRDELIARLYIITGTFDTYLDVCGKLYLTCARNNIFITCKSSRIDAPDPNNGDGQCSSAKAILYHLRHASSYDCFRAIKVEEKDQSVRN